MTEGEEEEEGRMEEEELGERGCWVEEGWENSKTSQEVISASSSWDHICEYFTTIPLVYFSLGYVVISHVTGSM